MIKAFKHRNSMPSAFGESSANRAKTLMGVIVSAIVRNIRFLEDESEKDINIEKKDRTSAQIFVWPGTQVNEPTPLGRN